MALGLLCQLCWSVLRMGDQTVAADANELDPALKRNLIALAESVRQISYHVLSRKAEIIELVEINEIIMQGLEGRSSSPADVAAE